MINIVGKRGWYFILSAALIIPGLLSMIAPPGWASGGSGLKPGIDFTSGSVLTIAFEEPVRPADVRSVLSRLGHPGALVQAVGDDSVLIRTRVLEEASGQQVSERQIIQDAMEESIGPIVGSGVDTVSPIIAQETVRNTFLALLVASVFILVYIWYAFRRVPRAYRYGVAAGGDPGARYVNRAGSVLDTGQSAGHGGQLHVHRGHPDGGRLFGERHHRGVRPYP